MLQAVVPWAVPLAGVGLWMVFPAFSEEFKTSLGLWRIGAAAPPAPEE